MKREDDKFKLFPPIGPAGINQIGLILTDPMGSYTGVPDEPGETPVQDADDL